MRMIDHQSLEDIARGSAVLASGGGGDPLRGKLSAQWVLSQSGPVPLVDMSELPDDALLATPFLIGAPVAFLEKFPLVDEIERTMLGLQKRLGRKIDAVYAVEIGGINSMLPFTLAARMGIPVLDADTMGRAFPELDMTLINLAGIVSSPIVVTDDYGTEVTIVTESNVILETIGRAVSHKFGASAAAAGFSGSLGELRAGLVEGSLSLAETIGRLMRAASSDPSGTWDDVLALTGGIRIFEGKVSSTSQEIEDGWGKGKVLIEGIGAYDGEVMRIDVVNENLLARVDGRPVATSPDIISVYDASSGAPLTSENVRFGYRVGVVALPCDPRWTTPAGIALGGPRRFGFESEYHDYRAVAELSPQSIVL